MANNLRLTHSESLWHPIQEGKVSLEIEVHKLAHKILRTPRTTSPSTEIPLGKVDPIIDGLDSQQSKSHQESKGRENVEGS